jgi:site-specific recombinase XerD
VTNTTINQDLKVLRKYLDIAVNKGWLKENPARKVKLLPEPKGRIPRCLYPDEINKIFQYLPQFNHLLHGEFEFIFLCLIYTGLRRSELCNLKPENIKLHLRQIHVLGKGKKFVLLAFINLLSMNSRKELNEDISCRPIFTLYQ